MKKHTQHRFAITCVVLGSQIVAHRSNDEEEVRETYKELLADGFTVDLWRRMLPKDST